MNDLDDTDKAIEIALDVVDNNDLTIHDITVIGAFLLAYANKHKFDRK